MLVVCIDDFQYWGLLKSISKTKPETQEVHYFYLNFNDQLRTMILFIFFPPRTIEKYANVINLAFQ